MLITENVEMKWNSSNKKYYVDKGYLFTKMRDSFDVKVDDLSINSHLKVDVKCDYCGKISNKTYQKYGLSHENCKIDACKGCYGNKQSEIKKLLSNNDSSYYEKIDIKIKKTNNERYGVDYIVQREGFQEEVSEKVFKKYGVKYSMQSPIVRKKSEYTILKKYGTINAMQNKEIKMKAMNALYVNKNAPTSNAQTLIHDVIGGELNYPVNKYFLDIAFPDEKVYLEYDGGGHDLQVKYGVLTEDEFSISEYTRYAVLKRNNWKEIRVINLKDISINEDSLKEFFLIALSFLNDENNNSICWNIADDTVCLNLKEVTELNHLKLKEVS